MFYLVYVALAFVLMRLDRAFSKLGEKILTLVDKEREVRLKSVSALHKGYKAKKTCEELAAAINRVGEQMMRTSKAKEVELLRRANALDLERKGVIHMQNHMAQVRSTIVDAKNTARLASPMAIRIAYVGRKLKFWK
ncbi:hypothetical protein [Aeromonas phage 25AhydR2PP]|uniref:Uncharacterized protein n=1 Tax=Aeromonas phage 25AhydR2PP TaxID=2163976 RepID=A0A2S1PFT6_9CAUD|nr:hypothetical protein HOT20_gp39 [Aeromonas phage 25AhydR2PP]AWH15432.1 hypothetical protein [Aeromonas phage 25AhydR2PP]